MPVVAVNPMAVRPIVRGAPVVGIGRIWPIVSIRIIPISVTVSVTGIAVRAVSVTRIPKPNSDSANPH